MTKHDNRAYTYLIGWRELDRWYYGSRHANELSPSDDLWKVYFTSSKYVYEMRKQYGEPDVIRVHKIFESSEAAHMFEYRFLKKVNAKSSKRWINQTIMGAPMGGTPNQIAWAKQSKSLATRERMRLGALKRWENDTVNRERVSALTKAKNPAINADGIHCRKGKHHSEESKQKMRDSYYRNNPQQKKLTRSEAQQARRKREFEKRKV